MRLSAPESKEKILKNILFLNGSEYLQVSNQAALGFFIKLTQTALVILWHADIQPHAAVHSTLMRLTLASNDLSE
jgi:hypothetical protein